MNMVDLYHRTSPEAADSIMASKRFEGDVVYGLKADFGQGFGPSRIHLRVPESIVHEDEDFSYWDDGTPTDDKDKYWYMHVEDLEPEHIVGRFDDCEVCTAERHYYGGDHATEDHDEHVRDKYVPGHVYLNPALGPNPMDVTADA